MKKNFSFSEISDLTNIRNYIGFMVQSKLNNVSNNDINALYEKMVEIDKLLVEQIKQMKLK